MTDDVGEGQSGEMAEHPKGQWLGDPDGRHEYRYFVHGQPTDLVSDSGTESLDEHGEWLADPSGRHEHRYFVQGQATLAVSDGGVQSVDSSSDRPTSSRRWIPIAVLGALVVVLGVLLMVTRSDLDSANDQIEQFEADAAVQAAAEAARPDVGAMAEEAFADSSDVVVSGDEESVSVAILYPGFDEIAALEGLLGELGFSTAVMDRMQVTRALDGTQSADGDQVNATWTYHPDNGLQVVFEVTD